MLNANCWLVGIPAWERAAEQPVLTCPSIWQTIINNLPLALWATYFAAVKFLPCEQKWHFCSRTSLRVQSAATHARRLALDRERETMYLFLPSKKHTEGWNQSSELVEPASVDVEVQLISLTQTLTCKQVNSEILLRRRMVVFLRNTNKYSLAFERILEDTLNTPPSPTGDKLYTALYRPPRESVRP